MSDEDDDSSHTESKKEYCPSVKCQNTGMLLDKIDELEKSLSRTKQYLRSKENLLGIQADQLKKLEQMYKDALDENQSMNYKSKKVSQDLENLKLVLKSHDNTANNHTNNEAHNNSVLLQNMQTMLKIQQSALGAIFALCYYIAWRQHENDKASRLQLSTTSIEKIENKRNAANSPPVQNNETIDILLAEINDLRSQVSKYRSGLRQALNDIYYDAEKIAEKIKLEAPQRTGENMTSKKMKITLTVPLKKAMQGHKAYPSNETPQVTAIKLYDNLSDESVSKAETDPKIITTFSTPCDTETIITEEPETSSEELLPPIKSMDCYQQQTETLPDANDEANEIPVDKFLIGSSFTTTSNEITVHEYEEQSVQETFQPRGAGTPPPKDESELSDQITECGCAQICTKKYTVKKFPKAAETSPNEDDIEDLKTVCTKAMNCNESALRDLKTEIGELKKGFVDLKDQLQQEVDKNEGSKSLELLSSIKDLQKKVQASDQNLRHALVAYQGDNDEINSLKNVCVKLLTDIPQFLASSNVDKENSLIENMMVLNDEVVKALEGKIYSDLLEKACIKHIQSFNSLCSIPNYKSNLPQSLLLQGGFVKSIVDEYRKQIDDLKNIHEPEIRRLNNIIHKLSDDLIAASNREEDLQEQLEKNLDHLYELQQSEKDHNEAIDQLEEKLLLAEQRCFAVDEALEKIKINCTSNETVSEYCEKCMELLDTVNLFKAKYEHLENNCQMLENQANAVNELKHKMNNLNEILKESENENLILQDRLQNINIELNRQMNKMVRESNQQEIIEELDRRLKKAWQEKKVLTEKLAEHHKAMEDYKSRLNRTACECEQYKNKVNRPSVDQMSLTDVLRSILEAKDVKERNCSLQEFIRSNEEDMQDILKANLVAQEVLQTPHDATAGTSENVSPAFLSLQRNIQLLLDNLREKQKQDNI